MLLQWEYDVTYHQGNGEHSLHQHQESAEYSKLKSSGTLGNEVCKIDLKIDSCLPLGIIQN